MEKMRFVLVGCGRIATLHVAGYKDRDDAELYGVYDKSRQTAEKFAAEHDIPVVYDSYEDVLADPTVTGVEILVPHHLHCEMTIKACEAKKHVSVQKPMALNLEECDKMIAAAKKNNVKLKVFENFVHYPPYLFIKDLIAKGEIGEIVGIRYKMNNGGLLSCNIPASKIMSKGANAENELEPTGWKVNTLSWTWRLNDTLAGGGPVVFDDGYHKFSLFLDIGGSVEKVKAWIDETPILGGCCQDCPAVVMWKYRDKKVYGVWDITSSDSLYIKSKYYTCDERMEITGSRGIIWLTRCTAEMLSDIAPVVLYKDGKITEYWDFPHDWQDSFIYSTHDFIDAIKEDREPVLSGERGREVLQFALAAIESARLNKEVCIDAYEDKPLQKKKSFIKILLARRKK
ncbi:MAG TPA: Gfo/Idh/MocA family oxidoreductase [Clostridia bacterium]|jgi:predicted dehydrogenase|nr:Gfo/Idh/MocA family oxidoreductase [Clostridia bacterium]